MKTVTLVAMVTIVLFVAGNARAGLLDRLLGIEAPETEMKASAAAEVPQELALWLLGTPFELDNPDAEFSARFGWRNDDTEFGCQFDAVGVHGENYESFGVYGLLFAGEIVGESYFGYAGSFGKERTISYGPFVGTVIDFVVAEVRYRDFAGDSPQHNAKDRWQVYAGLRLPF